MSKKYRSKWFRIATEGATTDQRQIQRSWIEEIVETFNPEKYGARLWLEHFRGVLPDSPFKAYGDVLAVKAEEIDVDGESRLALFAQIEPTDDLIAINKAKQKIYTSAEIDPQFSKTGKAYLTGVGITDSPASLCTEALKFSANHGTLATRKSSPTCLFTEAHEVALEFDEVTPGKPVFKELASKIKALLHKSEAQQAFNEQAFNELSGALTELVTFNQQQQTNLDEATAALASLREQLGTLSEDFTALKDQLANTDHHGQRPPVTGGNSQQLTDY